MIIDAMDIPLHRPLRRLCAGVQRQRLHPPGHPPAGGRHEGLRHGGARRPSPLVVARDKFVYIEGHPGRRRAKGRQGGKAEALTKSSAKKRRGPVPAVPVGGPYPWQHSREIVTLISIR